LAFGGFGKLWFVGEQRAGKNGIFVLFRVGLNFCLFGKSEKPSLLIFGNMRRDYLIA
jgi:hypothetical protein